MLTIDKYEELALGLYESADPLLTILNIERDLLPDNPEVWSGCMKALRKFYTENQLSNDRLAMFEPIEKMILQFRDVPRDMDRKIPKALFKMEHLFFYDGNLRSHVEKSEGKVPVQICCGVTIKIFEGLRTFNPSKEVFDLFKIDFHRHKIAKEYSSAKGDKVEILNTVFRQAKWLGSGLGTYYLEQIKADINHVLRDEIADQIEFQFQFDTRLQMESPNTEKEGKEILITQRNKEFTTARQVLVTMHYLLDYCQVRGIDQTKKAEFIEFLTGKNYQNIYTAVLNPLATKTKDFRKGDLQYIRTFFENLGLSEIVKAIGNELDKPDV